MKYIFSAAIKTKAIWILLLQTASMVLFVYINSKILELISLAVNTCDIKYINIIFALSVALMLLECTTAYCRIHRHYIFTYLNNAITDKILHSDESMFTELSTGKIATICESLWDMTEVTEILFRIVREISWICINVYMIISITTSQNAPLLIAGILIMTCLFYINMKWIRIDGQVCSIRRSRNVELHEIIDGYVEVRSFSGKVESHQYRINDMNNRILQLLKRRTILSFLSYIPVNIGNSVIMYTTLMWAMLALGDSLVTHAGVVTLIMYIWYLEQPLANLVDELSFITQIISKIPDFNKLMNFENNVLDGRIELAQFEECVEFNNVGFQYNQNLPVLSGLSLRINKGERVGICGESGGGKSTFLKLLRRAYDPTSGSITIDGVDIRNVTKNSLRKLIGVVPQEPFIFAKTIRENILYAKPDASDNEIIDVCKRAGIWTFIQSIPSGLDTMVGTNGRTLSGGQKQRISLARLLLANPEIVILDEATSSLDVATEKVVQDAIEALGGKTVITVAHRLSTIKNSDRLFIMKDMRLEKVCSFDEIKKIGG